MTRPPKPPSLKTLIGEGLTPLEFGRLIAAYPALSLEVGGNGAPVIVLPGLGAGNTSTSLLRGYLSSLGYSVSGWSLGRNRGNVRALLPKVIEQVRAIHTAQGSKIHMIGWSLGGILARETAREHPEMIRQVVTLGSPVVGGPKYTSMGAFYRQKGVDMDEMEATIAARESIPISVPVTSIYSKRDGVVGWQASIDRHTADVDHVEVSATHLGLGISPDVFRILARKLANA